MEGRVERVLSIRQRVLSGEHRKLRIDMSTLQQTQRAVQEKRRCSQARLHHFQSALRACKDKPFEPLLPRVSAYLCKQAATSRAACETEQLKFKQLADCRKVLYARATSVEGVLEHIAAHRTRELHTYHESCEDMLLEEMLPMFARQSRQAVPSSVVPSLGQSFEPLERVSRNWGEGVSVPPELSAYQVPVGSAAGVFESQRAHSLSPSLNAQPSPPASASPQPGQIRDMRRWSKLVGHGLRIEYTSQNGTGVTVELAHRAGRLIDVTLSSSSLRERIRLRGEHASLVLALRKSGIRVRSVVIEGGSNVGR